MPQRIIFFNCFHNGDIHVSRGFVRRIMEKVNQIDPSTTFSYAHRNHPALLADITNLKHDLSAMSHIKNEHLGVFTLGQTTYINTWYGQQNFKYMNRHGISLDSLYSALNDSCKSLWGFQLADITEEVSKFFPIIDYSKFEIDAAKTWLQSHTSKKIFVETGLALSGQSTNFAMTPVIISLANKHTDKIFILSNVERGYQLPNNVVYSSSIIKKNSTLDLNENSFLTTHCDVIVGRASGSFTFALTQENLFERKSKFICFTNLPAASNKFWLGDMFRDKINYSSEFIVRDESNPDTVFQIIDSNL